MEGNNQATATGTATGAQDNNNQAQSQTEGAANNSSSTAANTERTFTQAEVDAMIGERLARERRKQQQPAAQTQTDDGAAAGTAPAVVEVDVTEDARKQAQAIIAKANERLIQAIAQSEATKLNINPDYVADAVRLADLSAVTVNEDGTVDTKSVTAALEAVLTRMPVLKTQTETAAGGFKIGGQGGNNTQANGWTNTATKNPGETKRWNKNRY